MPGLPSARASLAVTIVLLGGLGRSALAAEPSPELVQDLEREVAPSTDARCPDSALYSIARPDPPGTPTVVGLGAYFQDLAALNDADQTLDLDVYVISRWRDPRLADPSRGNSSAECPVPAGRLWMPQLEPERLRSRQAFYPDRFLVDARGVATFVRRAWAKVAYPLDFRDFPFDRHAWTMTLWPVLSGTQEMVFHPLKRGTGIGDRLSLQGWRVSSPRVAATEGVRVGRSGTYARFDAVLELERDWSYYAWKLGLPLTLIVLMAYGVYFIPATAVPQQIGLGTTAMLTLIAYMLTLGNTLPKISYLTRADRFFVGSALLVFVGLMKALATLALAQSPKAQYIQHIDRWGRWFYPLALVANAALAFLT
jgi:Neurotransmitter-gated ion-channel ligand binding domain/Neurotransmitter-gated ion-channel transmembrane region